MALVRTQDAPPPSADTWFHLRFGREFRSDWAISHPGHLGVFDSADWIPTQWLSQIAMAWVEESFGVAGVIFAAGLLALLICVAVYICCRDFAAPLAAAIAMVATMLAAAPGISARPQLVSYLLVALTIHAWLRTARDGRPRYSLILLAWLWPMLHGMWPVGLSISFAAVVGIAAQRSVRGRSLVRLAVIPLASVALSVANPLGLATIEALVTVGSRSQYFAEWGATDFTEPAAAVLAGVVAVVLLALLRADRVPWPHVTLTLLGLGWAVYSLRTTPVAALILAPLLAMAMQRVLPEAPTMGRAEHSAVVGALALSTVLMASVALSSGSGQVVPVWVDERLRLLAPASRVLNDWDTGSYFLYRHPDLSFTSHGYGDVFTDEEIRRNVDLERLEPGWDDIVGELRPDVALVTPDSPLGYALQEQLGWTIIESDESFVLLTPPA